jgi:hypothetical protein
MLFCTTLTNGQDFEASYIILQTLQYRRDNHGTWKIVILAMQYLILHVNIQTMLFRCKTIYTTNIE